MSVSGLVAVLHVVGRLRFYRDSYQLRDKLVAGAQVSLPTKQPWRLEVDKPTQGELKGSHPFVR